MTGYIGIGGTAKKVKNIYVGVGGVAKKVKKGYIGVGGVAKLWYSSGWVWDIYTIGYNTLAGESMSFSSNKAFYAGTGYTIDQNTGSFTVDCSTQIARSSSGASTAVGKYFIAVDDTVPESSGTYSGSTLYLITAASYNWLTGLSLTLTPYTAQAYADQTVGSVSDDNVATYPVDGVQNGYYYVLRNDVAHMAISYSGNYVDKVVQMQSGGYRLLTLTGSGSLTLSETMEVDVWICGGGAHGRSKSGTYSAYGGGSGGYSLERDNISIKNLTATIGAEAGYSGLTGDISLQTAVAGANDAAASSTGCSGGSGGGGAASYYNGGTGDGVSKIPFGDNYFPYPFCGGGGGGSAYDTFGGNGGDNGNDGGKGGATGQEGLGGHYGGNGGARGNGALSISGGSAIGYGSGGGGQGYYNNSQVSGDTSNHYTGAGSGYQGVCFIRIPLEQ